MRIFTSAFVAVLTVLLAVLILISESLGSIRTSMAQASQPLPLGIDNLNMPVILSGAILAGAVTTVVTLMLDRTRFIRRQDRLDARLEKAEMAQRQDRKLMRAIAAKLRVRPEEVLAIPDEEVDDVSIDDEPQE